MKTLLEEIISPIVENMSMELYDIEYVKESGVRIVRLFIDKEGGVGLDDCEQVSRAVEVLLDEKDPIPHSYRLQVGSPGIERKLTKANHYTKYMGHDVTLKLFVPYKPNGSAERKTFTGQLFAYDGFNITIESLQEGKLSFPHSKVASCRLKVFDIDPKRRS